MTLVWQNAAVNDRFDQLDFIALDNPLAAVMQDIEIEQQTNMLTLQPKMGRAGRIKGTRELVIVRTPFIAIYRIKQERIEILRVLHGAQNWP
jgi:toxin ParE1/3/4